MNIWQQYKTKLGHDSPWSEELTYKIVELFLKGEALKESLNRLKGETK